MSTQTATQVEREHQGQRVSHAHLENPDWPGYALCLAKLTGLRTSSGDCPRCLELANANRAWIAR